MDTWLIGLVVLSREGRAAAKLPWAQSVCALRSCRGAWRGAASRTRSPSYTSTWAACTVTVS